MVERKHIIFLTGFMASGKSTIGPELAKKIGYEFVDVDGLIERGERKTISEIFHDDGEEFFRTKEREVLTELSHGDRRVVIALGGGTLTDQKSRSLVKKEGVLVYLKASPNRIVERVKSRRDRPMLLGADGAVLDDAALWRRIESLLNEREPHYLEAVVTVTTSDTPVSGTVDEIVSKLKGLIE